MVPSHGKNHFASGFTIISKANEYEYHLIFFCFVNFIVVVFFFAIANSHIIVNGLGGACRYFNQVELI